MPHARAPFHLLAKPTGAACNLDCHCLSKERFYPGGTFMLNNLVTSQSLTLATNGLMMVIGTVFVIASVSIVLAPKAARAVDAASIGH